MGLHISINRSGPWVTSKVGFSSGGFCLQIGAAPTGSTCLGAWGVFSEKRP